jgi:hypothetical protein
MDEGQIGHVRPHLKGSGDFTIHVRWAHIRRVFLNFISQLILFLRPLAPCSDAIIKLTTFNYICNIIAYSCLEVRIVSGECWNDRGEFDPEPHNAVYSSIPMSPCQVHLMRTIF